MRVVIESIKWSNKILPIIKDVIKDSTCLVFVPIGKYKYSLYSSYLAFKTLTNVKVEYLDPESLINFILPYRDVSERFIILYDGGTKYIGKLLRVMDVIRLLKCDYILFTSQLPQDIIRRLGAEILIYDEKVNPILSVNYLLLSAIVKYLKCISNKRCNRLMIELMELTSIINDLFKHYESALTQLRNSISKLRFGSMVGIISTPSLEILTEISAELLSTNKIIPLKLTYNMNIENIQEFLDLILIFTTDLEDVLVKEVIPPMKIKRPHVELRIKTDPLTAPLYGVILLEKIKTYFKG